MPMNLCVPRDAWCTLNNSVCLEWKPQWREIKALSGIWWNKTKISSFSFFFNSLVDKPWHQQRDHNWRQIVCWTQINKTHHQSFAQQILWWNGKDVDFQSRPLFQVLFPNQLTSNVLLQLVALPVGCSTSGEGLLMHGEPITSPFLPFDPSVKSQLRTRF